MKNCKRWRTIFGGSKKNESASSKIDFGCSEKSK